MIGAVSTLRHAAMDRPLMPMCVRWRDGRPGRRRCCSARPAGVLDRAAVGADRLSVDMWGLHPGLWRRDAGGSRSTPAVRAVRVAQGVVMPRTKLDVTIPSLSGKLAVVTGASDGIGLGLAERLAGRRGGRPAGPQLGQGQGR